MAADVATRFGVRFVDLAGLRRLQADSSRTTHVFDVRQVDEFEAGHLPGSLNAPGGQLVQATDTFVATRGARIALIDQHEVQAVMTAHWLLQMGWRDVHVVRGALDDTAALQTGSVCLPVLDEASLTAPLIDVETVVGSMATIIDVGDSLSWRQSGIPGSYWAMRSALKDCLTGRFANDEALVFVCNDGRLSRFAAQDAVRLGWTKSCALKGGRAAWYPGDQTTDRRSGATAQAGDRSDRLLCEPDDMWVPPYARPSGAHEAMQQYLTWELNLLEQLAREPYLRFS
jgi:rhodanese-related sulfurtransferase